MLSHLASRFELPQLHRPANCVDKRSAASSGRAFETLAETTRLVDERQGSDCPVAGAGLGHVRLQCSASRHFARQPDRLPDKSYDVNFQLGYCRFANRDTTIPIVRLGAVPAQAFRIESLGPVLARYGFWRIDRPFPGGNRLFSWPGSGP